MVLLSPILAGNDLYVKEFAGFFAARGLHAVLVYRQKEVFSPDRDLKDIESHLKESIIQLRQTIDWLEIQESVDVERIGSFAISLGAILTSILAAVEPRIKCSVLGLPAGLRWVAQHDGLQDDLGHQGPGGILQSLATRAACLSDPTPPLGFHSPPTQASWMHHMAMWCSIVVRQ